MCGTARLEVGGAAPGAARLGRRALHESKAGRAQRRRAQFEVFFGLSLRRDWISHSKAALSTMPGCTSAILPLRSNEHAYGHSFVCAELLGGLEASVRRVPESDRRHGIGPRNGRAPGPALSVDEFAAFQLGQGFNGLASFFLGEAQVVEVLQ